MLCCTCMNSNIQFAKLKISDKLLVLTLIQKKNQMKRKNIFIRQEHNSFGDGSKITIRRNENRHVPNIVQLDNKIQTWTVLEQTDMLTCYFSLEVGWSSSTKSTNSIFSILNNPQIDPGNIERVLASVIIPNIGFYKLSIIQKF